MPHDEDDYELSDEELLAREEQFKKTPEFDAWKSKSFGLPRLEQDWLHAQPKEVQDYYYMTFPMHGMHNKLLLAVRDAMREEKRFKDVGEFLRDKKADNSVKLLKFAEEFDTFVEAKKKSKNKKLDPKAKVRNRGTVCVPASSAKDKKDHFPINSIGQGRNALCKSASI